LRHRISFQVLFNMIISPDAQSDFYMDLRGGGTHEALESYVIFTEVGIDEVSRISKEAEIEIEAIAFADRID